MTLMTLIRVSLIRDPSLEANQALVVWDLLAWALVEEDSDLHSPIHSAEAMAADLVDPDLEALDLVAVEDSAVADFSLDCCVITV
jgi:hypothetical protein